MVVLERSTITLDGMAVPLLRESEARALRNPDDGTSGRSWEVVQKPIATPRESRSDVRPGELDDEGTIIMDNWSKGFSGDMENLPGCPHYSVNINTTQPGSISGRGRETTVTQSATNEEEPPTVTLIFNNILFEGKGRLLRSYNDGVAATDRDFGAGLFIYDAIVHNNEMVIALGGSGGGTRRIYTRTTGGVFTQAADNVHADHFAVVEGKLWRATATNGVSNIGVSDNPRTLANWSASIDVGSKTYGITDLNGFGERLAVSKPEGMFIGDASAIFPNVLPLLVNSRDPDNGKGTLVRGSDIFYLHSDGLLRYSANGRVEEVGPQTQFPSAEPADDLPGLRLRAIAAQGNKLWGVAFTDGLPRARPTVVKLTANAGVSYTNLLANATDNDQTTTSDISSMDTVANGDWLLIGYSSTFYGVQLILGTLNSNATNLSVSFWNGSAWVALGVGAAFHNRTGAPSDSDPMASPTVSLGRSGAITWDNNGLGAWVSSTIDGVAAFYIRIESSALLSTTVSIAECWVQTSVPYKWVMVGRPQRSDDVRQVSIIWENYARLTGGFPGSILVVQNLYPHRPIHVVAVAARQTSDFVTIPPRNYIPTETQHPTTTELYTAKHDAGAPSIDKLWRSVRLKGRRLSATRTVVVSYRLNSATAWTSLGTFTSDLSTLNFAANVSSALIQFRVAITSATNDVVQGAEVLALYINYRELPVYIDVYTFMCALEMGTSHALGGQLRSAAQTLTRLENMMGGNPVTLLDPLRRNRTVKVSQVKTIEKLQEGLDYPITAVKLVATEF